ncbi:MAG: M20/M25/M40 family metallo-hydrolase [Gemmatimonadales bacterium]
MTVRPLAVLAAVTVAAAAPAAAQTDDPAIREALGIPQRDNDWTVAQQISLCEIPAPPFKEAARAAEYANRFRALGYEATVDQVGNVIAVRKGTGGGRRFMIAAHLDTVFPEGTDVKVKREGTKLIGPGIGDACRGLAVVLAVARAMSLAKVTTKGDVVFVGNVGEEGPGNLRGVRHLFGEKSAGPVDAFVSVDGIGYGLVSRAVGSNRYLVSFEGPGGHSYGAFGMPNPIHAMGRAIAGIGDIQVPEHPKTTFNVGIVEGGTSVNSISFKATMQVDLRSESAEQLALTDATFRKIVDNAIAAEKARWPRSKAALTAAFTDMGQRPCGAQPDTLWIVRTAQKSATSSSDFFRRSRRRPAPTRTYRSALVSRRCRSTAAAWVAALAGRVV